MTMSRIPYPVASESRDIYVTPETIPILIISLSFFKYVFL
jgi:hypothetical protein